MATRQEVVEFLHIFKSCSMLNRYTVKDREKNRQALINLGVSASDRRNIIMGLEPEDYVGGPKQDATDNTKKIWEFGKRISGTDVYIKLRVAKDPRKSHVHHALVWSFHPAEFPLKYPLGGGGP